MMIIMIMMIFMNIMMIFVNMTFFLIEDFSSSKKIFFFCIYKMYLISAEGYKNACVHFLKLKKTDEIWVSMKEV